MKKNLFCNFCIVLLFSVNVFAIDLSIFNSLPKTEFDRATDNSVDVTSLTGHIEPVQDQSSAEYKQFLKDIKNSDFIEKSKTRGIQRPQKVDVYGDLIPLDFLYYRENLSPAEKDIYDAVYNAIAHFDDSVTVEVDSAVYDLTHPIYSVCYDNPEFFWWDRGFYSSWCFNNIRKTYEYTIRLKYLFTEKDLPRALDEFNSKTFPVLYYASLLETDAEKMKYIHDYICNTTVYDHAAANTYCGGLYQTAYSCSVSYSTVCAGYAKSYAYYLQQLGIPCVYIHSRTHAWNLLKYNENYYQTDVYWDDGSFFGKASSLYYLKSNDEMKAVDSHVPDDLSVNVVKNHKTRGSSLYGHYDKVRNFDYKEISNFLIDVQNPELLDFGIAKNKRNQNYSNIQLNASFTDARGNIRDKVFQNERVQIHLKPEKNCYIAVLLIDAKGNKSWLDIKNNYLKASKEKILPDKSGYELVVDSDLLGHESIRIYASSEDIGLPIIVDSSKLANVDLHFIMKTRQQILNKRNSSIASCSISYEIVQD